MHGLVPRLPLAFFIACSTGNEAIVVPSSWQHLNAGWRTPMCCEKQLQMLQYCLFNAKYTINWEHKHWTHTSMLPRSHRILYCSSTFLDTMQETSNFTVQLLIRWPWLLLNWPLSAQTTIATNTNCGARGLGTLCEESQEVYTVSEKTWGLLFIRRLFYCF